MQDNLTLRELEVLRLAAQGLKNHEIAARMELALKTIEHMLGCSDPYRALYLKIGVTNRAEAIAWYCDTVGIADEGKKITERLSEHLLEMYTDYAERVYTLRIGGQPGLARDMASFLIAHTTRAAQDAATPAYREAFLRVRATGLVEQGMLHLETTPPSQILSRIKPIFVTLQAMGQELHDDDLVAIAYATLAEPITLPKTTGRVISSMPRP